MEIKQLFAMGGYGMYVWSAYAITLVVILINLVAGLYEKQQVKKIISHYLKLNQKA